MPADLADAATAAREALIEMVAEADDALMEKFFEAGTLTQDELVGGPASATSRRARSSRCCARRRLQNIGVQPLLDAIARLRARRPPSARSRRKRGGDDAVDVPPTTRRRTPRSCGRPWPIRSPAASRCSASSRARSRPTPRSHNVDAGHARAARAPDRAAGQDADQRAELKAGDLGAVAKLKDTLTNDTLADKTAGVHVRADQVPRAGAVVRHRAEEPRRRGQDQHRDAPPRGRGPDASATAATRRPTSCCSPARASCTSRSRSRS